MGNTKFSIRASVRYIIDNVLEKSAWWSSDNAFVSRAGGLRFKSWAGQSGRSVANCSTPLQSLFERRCVAHRRNDAKKDPVNSSHASALYSEYNERSDLMFQKKSVLQYRSGFLFGVNIFKQSLCSVLSRLLSK